MVRRLGVALTAATLPISMTVAPANAQEEDINAQVMSTPSGRVTLPFDYSRPIERFMVKFNHFTGRTDTDRINTVKEAARQNGTEAEFVEQGLGGVVLFELNPPIPPEKSLSMVATLESKAEIVYSEPDYYQQELATPNDPLFKHQWALQEYGKPQNPTRSSHGINAVGAWDLGYKGEGVNIAIVDSGITDHPDLNRKVLPGYDFISDPVAAGDGNGRDQDPSDMGSGTGGKPSSWHGTHVAGVAAADTNNGIGVAGVAPDAKILPVRAMGRGGGTTYDITQGILWAAGVSGIDNVPKNPNPAKVINLSLGAKNRCNPMYQDSINLALAHGATLVVAAGNSNVRASTFSPASCDGVITVGATGPYGKRAWYSNYDRIGSSTVDIAAPGGDAYQFIVDSDMGDYEMIVSTLNSGVNYPLRGGATYGQQQGTSQAAPAISGVIAMMLHANPELSTEDIRSILQSTANPFAEDDYDRNIGAGIANAYEAVCEAIRRNPDITESPCEREAKPSPTSTTLKPSTTATSAPAAPSTVTETATETETVTSTAATPTVTRTVTSTAPTPTVTSTSHKRVWVTETRTQTATATATTVLRETKSSTPTVARRETTTVTPTVTATETAKAKTTVLEPSTLTTTSTTTPKPKTVTTKTTALTTVTPPASTTTLPPRTSTATEITTTTPVTVTSVATTVTKPGEVTKEVVEHEEWVTVTTTPEAVTSTATVTQTSTVRKDVTTTQTTTVNKDGKALPAVTAMATVTADPTTVRVTDTVVHTTTPTVTSTKVVEQAVDPQPAPQMQAEPAATGSSGLTERCTTALTAAGVPLALFLPAGIAVALGLPVLPDMGNLAAPLPAIPGVNNDQIANLAAPAAAVLIGVTVIGLVANACLAGDEKGSSTGSSR